MPKIIASGHLKPATLYIDEGETPVVWFSARQDWEPTAKKIDPMRGRPMDLDEMRDFGIVRFGIPSDYPRVVKWSYHRRKHGVSVRTARALEAAGREDGADPRDWFGVPGNVLIEDCCDIQEWDNKAKEWRSIKTRA